jgi:hypothetical protein
VTSADVRLSVGQESPTARKGVLYPSRQIGPNYVFTGQVNCRGVGKAPKAQLRRNSIDHHGGLDVPAVPTKADLPDPLTRASCPSLHPFFGLS